MSEFLENLLRKAKAGNDDLWDDLPGQAPVIVPTEKNAVRRDTFDKLGWDMLADQVPALKQHVDELGEEFETSPPAYEDLFNMLNQGDPRFQPTAEMLDGYKPQRQMLEEMSTGVEFDMLRKETRYDEYNTAFAMLTMKDAMREAFENIRDAIDDAQAAEQALQEAIDGAEQAQQSGQGQDEAAEALQAAMAAQQAAQQAGQDAAEQAVEGLRQGSRDARDEIKSEQESMAGWGLDDGELRTMSFEERRALAERLDSAKLKRLAKLIGTFRSFGDAERRRKIKHAPEEIYDVEMGNDLSKLIASERTALAVPELEDSFWVRWARQGLLQWKVRGRDKADQGPIIVVCDESDSMSTGLDAAGNTREAWSKAVSMALCDQAKRAGRDFTYIGFSSPTQQWQIDFPGGVAPLEKVITFVEHFYAGGTSYVEPLTRAMGIIRDYDKIGKSKPDVVFITDDDCRVPASFIEEWATLRERVDVRCYGIQIGGSAYSNNLKDLADRCINLSKLNSNPEGVQELFRTI